MLLLHRGSEKKKKKNIQNRMTEKYTSIRMGATRPVDKMKKKNSPRRIQYMWKKEKKSLVKGSQDAGLMQSGISRQTLPRGSDRAERTGQRRAGGSDREEVEEGQIGI